MATVNEKMTQLANAIRTKSGATGKLSLDGMISAVNGITTGGSSTQTYTLWGSHSLATNDEFDVGHLAGSYQVPVGIATYFYDGNDSQQWVFDNIEVIQVYSDGSIDIRSTNYDTSNVYLPADGVWADENEVYINDGRLLLLDIPSPVSVNEQLYQLLTAILDNGNYDVSAYGLGVRVGTSQSSGDLEALGALCDWNVVVDSGSQPIVTIVNYHPSYYLVCDVYYGDLSATDWCISPNDSDSIYWRDYEPGFGMQGGEGVFIESVRWVPNEI